LVSGANGIEIISDESCANILIEELNKFIKFYGLEIETNTKEVTYKFFKNTAEKDYFISKW